MHPEQEYNSICFHRNCIRGHNQLFLATPHSASPHEQHAKTHTRPLRRQYFQPKYALPRGLIKTRLQLLAKAIKGEEVSDQFDEFLIHSKKCFHRELLKHSRLLTKCLKPQDCANLVKRLRTRSRKARDEDLQIANELHHADKRGMSHLIERKLKPVNEFIDSPLDQLFSIFYELMPIYFARKFEVDTVKIEEEDQSEQYQVVMEESQEEEQNSSIKEEKAVAGQNNSPKKKRRNRLKHLQAPEFQRPRTRKDYIQLHNFGKDTDSKPGIFKRWNPLASPSLKEQDG